MHSTQGAHVQVGLALARNAEGSSAALGILSAMGLTPSSRGWVEELGQLLAPEALRRSASLANAFLMVLPAPVRPVEQCCLMPECLGCISDTSLADSYLMVLPAPMRLVEECCLMRW